MFPLKKTKKQKSIHIFIIDLSKLRFTILLPIYSLIRLYYNCRTCRFQDKGEGERENEPQNKTEGENVGDTLQVWKTHIYQASSTTLSLDLFYFPTLSNDHQLQEMHKSFLTVLDCAT